MPRLLIETGDDLADARRGAAAQQILLSTPAGAGGEFHRAWSSGEDWERVQITADQCRASPLRILLPSAFAGRRSLPPGVFRRLRLSAGSVFDAEVLFEGGAGSDTIAGGADNARSRSGRRRRHRRRDGLRLSVRRRWPMYSSSLRATARHGLGFIAAGANNSGRPGARRLLRGGPGTPPGFGFQGGLHGVLGRWARPDSP